MSTTISAMAAISVGPIIVLLFIALVILGFLPRLLGIIYIPHDKTGVIEKLWSHRGSLQEGRILALNGEAGFQAKLLRGGLHFGLFPWQYRVKKMPLIKVSEGSIGYIYAKDGVPLEATQTLGRGMPLRDIEDAEAFINNSGQRGRQRTVLREGVYAINLGLFVIITEDGTYSSDQDVNYDKWQEELRLSDAFHPVVIGNKGAGAENDEIGVVTIQDGPTLASNELIAPEVPSDENGGHNYFQNPDTFLALGGKRGRQLQTLTDGTFFINRWFATVEIHRKTTIPIGHVGVVVSYHGDAGGDVTGDTFRYGEQVERGSKGVWKQALTPGKYALNPYAVKLEIVPTVNFVLRWITGQSENHKYDDQLSTIELITSDGYEPLLPLSLVLHIDYQKAPSVVQRFGDVKRLITQTLDPILTAYFRDVAQHSTMLELLTHREDIQKEATEELGRRFREFDINCVAVLIGRPESKVKQEEKDPIEKLFDQLRQRRLADEQRDTYAKQQEAATHLKALEEAQAIARQQASLTESKIAIEVATNQAEARLAEAVRAAKQKIALAEGESRAERLRGEGEAARISAVGMAEAEVSRMKVEAYGDARLFAMRDLAQALSHSTQPLVPERMLITGGNGGGDDGVVSPLVSLLHLLLSEKADIGVMAPAEVKDTSLITTPDNTTKQA